MKKWIHGFLLSAWVSASLVAAEVPSKINPVELYKGVVNQIETQQGSTTNYHLWKTIERLFADHGFEESVAISAHGVPYPYQIELQRVQENVDPRTLQSSFASSYIPLSRLGELPDAGVLLVSRRYHKKENQRMEQGTVLVRVQFRLDTETKTTQFIIQSVQTQSGPPEGLRMKALGNSSGAGG